MRWLENHDMSPSIRLLPFVSSDGATNMARDEAMLESAVDGVASVRFYTWNEPTLSLGYFQATGVRETASLAPLAWVRRSTGGAGIIHHHELTYSFALPANMAKTDESWICRFHRMLSESLASRGLASKVVACGEEQRLGEVLCFLHQTPGDLLIERSKVAGSAQRKMRGALLQHGSILLRSSEHAPQLKGINDFAGKELFTSSALADLLAWAFAADTGAKLEPGEWTADERARVLEIRSEKYASADWNGRR